SHCWEWNSRPWKLSRPLMFGNDGVDRPPMPEITKRAVKRRPSRTSISHSCRVSSHFKWLTSVFSRVWEARSKRSQQDSRYCLISGCGANMRDHSGFGAKENEYRCDCTSQAQPG